MSLRKKLTFVHKKFKIFKILNYQADQKLRLLDLKGLFSRKINNVGISNANISYAEISSARINNVGLIYQVFGSLFLNSSCFLLKLYKKLLSIISSNYYEIFYFM